MNVSKLNIYLIAFLIGIYVLFTPPFIFSEYIPFSFRVVLELIPILFFLAVLNRKSYPLVMIASLFVWSMLVLMMFLYTESAIASVFYSYLKILFFILLVVILDSTSEVYDVIKKTWLAFWFFVSLCVILGFCLYQLNIIDFTFMSFEDILGKESYHYYSHAFFGNFIQSYMLGIPVPRMTWYLFEPSMLAFFFGVNVLIADALFANKDHAKKFKLLNLVAGLLTFSNTFIIFFILYGVVMLFRLKLLRSIFYLVAPVVLISAVWVIYTALFNTELGSSTSLGDRTLRLEMAYYFLEHNTLLSFLYGNGLGVSTEIFGKGLSSGLLSVLVERGFLVFLFLVFLFYMFAKHNKALLFFLFFYSLAFEVIWYPLLLVAIAISYVADKQAQGDESGCQGVMDK